MARVFKLSQIALRGPDDELEDWTEDQQRCMPTRRLPESECSEKTYETENEEPENRQTDPRQCGGIPIQNVPPEPSLVRQRFWNLLTRYNQADE